MCWEFWDKERKYIDEDYRTVPFGFDELPAKDFKIAVKWSKNQLIGYLYSWSSVQHYKKETGDDPIKYFLSHLNKYWDDISSLELYFPVFLRLGLVG